MQVVPPAKLYLIKIVSQTFISEQEHFSPQYFFIDFLPKEVTSSSFHRSGGGRLSRVWGWLSWKSCQPGRRKEVTYRSARETLTHSSERLICKSTPLQKPPTRAQLTLLPETTISSRVPEIHPFMSAWDSQTIFESVTHVDHLMAPLCWSTGWVTSRGRLPPVWLLLQVN